MFLVFVVDLLDWLFHADYSLVSVALRVCLTRVELLNSILQVRPFVYPPSRFSLKLLPITIIGTHSQKLLPFVDQMCSTHETSRKVAGSDCTRDFGPNLSLISTLECPFLSQHSRNFGIPDTLLCKIGLGSLTGRFA